jgi:L-lysine 6-transaminase
VATDVFSCDAFDKFVTAFQKHTFSTNYHFNCTGALAIESALKSAMEYKRVSTPLVISINNSFHGVNSWGFVTSRVGVTEKRMQYYPSNDWLQLDLDGVVAYLKNQDLSNLVAVVIEPIQATNGDIYLSPEKLRLIRDLCQQHDICFIVDEIQTGFGVTGKMWYCDHLNLVPDILVFGKKAQVCGIVLSDKYAGILDDKYKKLGVTFNGDLIDMIRSTYIMKAYEELNILSKVRENSEYISKKISHKVNDYRSLGFLIAFDFASQKQRDEYIDQCYKNRVIVNRSGEKTVRLRPNMALTKQEMEVLIERLSASLTF